MKNKYHIIADTVDVYLALSGASPGNKPLWFDAGWCEEGQTRFKVSGVKNVSLNRGYNYLAGLEIDFKANLLQSDAAHLDLLQSFINQPVDIYLASRRSCCDYLLKEILISYQLDFSFTLKKANTVLLSAQKKIRPSDLSKIFKPHFIVGIDYFAKV